MAWSGQGQRIDLRSHARTEIRKLPPEKPSGWCRPLCGATIKVVQHRPYLLATQGPATGIVRHRCQRAVAPCHRRGRPLEGPGRLICPRVPACEPCGREPPGARVPLQGVLHRLERPGDLGLLLWTARACSLFLPVPQRQQQLLPPWGPPRGHGHMLHVVPHRLPPEVDQRRDPSKRRTDLRQGALLHRQPVRGQPCFERLELDMPLAFPPVTSGGSSPPDARGAPSATEGREGGERHRARPASAAPRPGGPRPRRGPAEPGHGLEATPATSPGAAQRVPRPAGRAADDRREPAKSPWQAHGCGETHPGYAGSPGQSQPVCSGPGRDHARGTTPRRQTSGAAL